MVVDKNCKVFSLPVKLQFTCWKYSNEDGKLSLEEKYSDKNWIAIGLYNAAMINLSGIQTRDLRLNNGLQGW